MNESLLMNALFFCLIIRSLESSLLPLRRNSVASEVAIDHPSEADNCNCKNGYCEKNSNGKLDCNCPIEFGKYSHTECKKCDCGENNNCTFQRNLFRMTKICICGEGYEINAYKNGCIEKDACAARGRRRCRESGEKCVNEDDTYKCLRCQQDEKLDDNGNCIEKDVCVARGRRICQERGEKCENEGNTYKCVRCRKDEKLNDKGDCIGIDACEKEGKETCQSIDAQCLLYEDDTYGYICEECPEEEKLNESGKCIDKDECEKGGTETCLAKGEICLVSKDQTEGYICEECPEGKKLHESGKCIVLSEA